MVATSASALSDADAGGVEGAGGPQKRLRAPMTWSCSRMGRSVAVTGRPDR
jgi:hypothetical protein